MINNLNNNNFTNACINGNIFDATNIVKTNPNTDISTNIDFLVYTVCKKGYEKILKLLYIIKPNLSSTFDNIHAFKIACDNGHFLVIKLLLIINPNIDICADNNYAFKSACANGYFSIVNLLLIINPNLNICVNNNSAFKLACTNRHFLIVRLLLKIKSDIDIDINCIPNIEDVFSNACECGYFEFPQLVLKKS